MPLKTQLSDWVKLNDNERYFIKNVLAFFASSDGIVNENLILNFYNEVQLAEMRQFYASQIMMESIHSQTYAVMIETYVKNEKEKNLLFSALENNNAVKLKGDWAIKWNICRASFSFYPRRMSIFLRKFLCHLLVKKERSYAWFD